MGHLPYSLSLSSSHGWPAPLLWQRDKWHWQTPCQLKFWWSQILVVTKYRRHKTFWLLAWRLVHFDDYLGKKSWCRQLLNVYCIYTPLQKYWNSEANSFIFAVYWKNLGLTSKMNMRQEISISAFISRYSYLDLINNLEDSRALDSFFPLVAPNFLSWSHEHIIWSQLLLFFFIQHLINQCMLMNFYDSL